MNRCATCFHWDKFPEDQTEVVQGTGKCLAARQFWEVTDSFPPDHQTVMLPEHAGLLCMVEDGSHYAAVLITMPDFGCVMHKEKVCPSP